jgi:hypothetical protein
MAVDGDAVDLVNAERARRKRRHRNRRGDDRIDLSEYFEKRRAQAVTTIAGLDIFNAAVGRALRHHIAVVVIGGHQRSGAAGGDGRRLLGIGDRFQDSLKHIWCEMDAIGNDVGAK